METMGSGGIEKSHSCKWAKWIQWHALPHIQQSTQQWNKGHNPNLHGWDFSIPPSPNYAKKAKSPLAGVHSIEGSMYGGLHCVHGDSIIPAKWPPM